MCFENVFEFIAVVIFLLGFYALYFNGLSEDNINVFI